MVLKATPKRRLGVQALPLHLRKTAALGETTEPKDCVH
jgi:hypothetical protein